MDTTETYRPVMKDPQTILTQTTLLALMQTTGWGPPGYTFMQSSLPDGPSSDQTSEITQPSLHGCQSITKATEVIKNHLGGWRGSESKRCLTELSEGRIQCTVRLPMNHNRLQDISKNGSKEAVAIQTILMDLQVQQVGQALL